MRRRNTDEVQPAYIGGACDDYYFYQAYIKQTSKNNLFNMCVRHVL
jgi:hypothetical protein